MLFIDNAHEDFYNKKIGRINTKDDPYRKALFYTLGLTEETRKHINDLYDFTENGTDVLKGISQEWQTGTTLKVTRLAYNLYNGFNGYFGEQTIDNPSNYTPYEIFCNNLSPYFFNAIKLRYSEYFKNVNIVDEQHTIII